MKHHRSSILLIAFLALASIAFAFKSHILSQNVGEALAASAGIELRAERVPLSDADPALDHVGALDYLAGWAITATHDRFGGLSGLTVSKDGKLVAISDQGDWLSADFDPASATPLTGARLHPFAPDMPSDSKEWFDAESIIRAGEDGFLVSLEQTHRLVLAAPDMPEKPWAPSARMDFTGVANNSGMEAITWIADGRLLAFAERGVDTDGRLKGWLVGEDAVDTIYFKPPVNFAPTDAALLPNGDILVLTRFYSVVDGVAVKLIRVKAADIRAGATLVGEELAHLAPPLTVDNMEGLDVGMAADGSIIVYMLSDDNFNSSQRTLLLMFALKG